MAMRIPSQAELVEMWERGSGQPSFERALIVLSVCSDESREQLAQMSIGQRDGRLLEVYRGLFGSFLDAFAECPACTEPLEYRLAAGTLVSAEERGEKTLMLETSDARVELRAPNSFDLEAIDDFKDLSEARNLLLERCVVSASLGGTRVSTDKLPAPLVEQIDAKLAEADQQAEMMISLECSACGHAWQVLLDIERFLWAKISALAKRLLSEVHVLASAYGWTETDVLSLGSARRQLYLDMVGSWTAS